MPTKRILVVDDEPTIADTTVMVLNLKGYEAVAVYSGEAAVALAPTYRPDFALIDVMMGDLNGIEASIAILEQLPDCRIILVSGRQETAKLLQSEHEKGNMIDVLAKPIHPQFLLDTLSAQGSKPIEN
jgi:CheY-like chemotaxis protein